MPEVQTPPPAPSGLDKAPIVWLALAVTGGVVLQRLFSLNAILSFIVGASSIAAWFLASRRRNTRFPAAYLAVALVSLSAAYYYLRVEHVRPDDIGLHLEAVNSEAIRVTGVLTDAPMLQLPTPAAPLTRSWGTDGLTSSTRTEMRVTSLETASGLVSVSGSVRVNIRGQVSAISLGDEVRATGRLVPLHEAANPGEYDRAWQLRRRGISAELSVASAEDVQRLNAANWLDVTTWPGRLQAQGQRVLADPALPFTPAARGLTGALLLGEGSTFTSADWDRYKRTGVVHALAISGQHLAVLGAFLWLVLRAFRVPGRRGAIVVAMVVFSYALITGGRPPAMRAAITVAAVCGGLILRRPSTPLNDFALAWLVVLLVDPTEIFNPGCQLSFLSVAVLVWGALRFFRWPWLQEPDPLEKLVDEARPRWVRGLRMVGWLLLKTYAVGAVIWLAVLPLVAYHYHIIPVIALLISPPIVILTSVALILGFLLLVAASFVPLAAVPMVWLMNLLLGMCDILVTWADRVPGGHFHAGDIPLWWLLVFEIGLLTSLFEERLHRRARWLILAGVGWICLGLALPVFGSARELRCTFLAVGHGGCTVLETPDGRTILYDVGSMGRPDVVRWQVAPFLRSRGVQRVDEVFLSHADTDHFNGLVQLLDFFPVGQVTLSATFQEKPTDAVQFTLRALRDRPQPIAVRVVKAGDRLTAGDMVVDILNPPEQGLHGNENANSLVLLIHHQRNRILLTGDLADTGLDRLLTLSPQPVDVLMAPHHGSRAANTPQLAAWARPRWVISSQGPPRSQAATAELYAQFGATYLTTWEYGAVTVQSRSSGLSVEAFLKPIAGPESGRNP